MRWPNAHLNYAVSIASSSAQITADLQYYKDLGFTHLRQTFNDYTFDNATITQRLLACQLGKDLGFHIVCGVASNTGKLNQATYPTYRTFMRSQAVAMEAIGVDVFEVGNETERDIYKTPTSITQAGNVATVTLAAHGFTSGTRAYVTQASPSNYNTPAYVDPGNPGGAVITVLDANTFTYPISGNPASPATGSIRVGNIGVKEVEDLLLADAADIRDDQLFTGQIAYSFNDTYLPNWIAIGVAGITALDILGFHKYKTIAEFKTDVDSFLATFGASGKVMIDEWGSENGKNDFKTSGAIEQNWQRWWEMDTYKRLKILQDLTALYAEDCPTYFYSAREGQQIWSLKNIDDNSYNYPLAVLAGRRRWYA